MTQAARPLKIVPSPKTTTEVDAEIGARIRARREQLGHSQAYMADLVGITFQQFHKYETGDNRVAVAMLIKIAAALDLDPVDLLPGAPRRTRAPARKRSPDDKMADQLQAAFAKIAAVQERRLVLNMARRFAANSPAPARKARARVKR